MALMRSVTISRSLASIDLMGPFISARSVSVEQRCGAKVNHLMCSLSRRSIVSTLNGGRSGGSAHSPLHLLFCLFSRPAVPRLEESDELFGFALDAVQLVVRELTPP
jgi:hypothetical protein